MELTPFDWNAIIIGHWNPAILTPAGIARRLFGLQNATPVRVEVPMDGLAPYRVVHEHTLVLADANRLLIGAMEPSFDVLHNAMETAVKALNALPETPVTAAGFNVRYKTEDPPPHLLDVTRAQIDSTLADAGWTIVRRELTRALDAEPGRINLEIKEEDDDQSITIVLNFHRHSSEHADLIEWLSTPVDRIKEMTRRTCEAVLGSCPAEVAQ